MKLEVNEKMRYKGFQNDADRLAILALEKQVPKKPITQKAKERTKVRFHVYFGKGTTLYNCPSCGKFLTPSMNYCDGCGQRMDWGDPRKGGQR